MNNKQIAEKTLGGVIISISNFVVTFNKEEGQDTIDIAHDGAKRDYKECIGQIINKITGEGNLYCGNDIMIGFVIL